MFNLFAKKIPPEVLSAYLSRIPKSIEVQIKPSMDGGYWIKISNLPGCVTQANNGRELFEMVNDAIYTHFDIPQRYISIMPKFLPSEETRKKFRINVPSEILKEEVILQRT